MDELSFRSAGFRHRREWVILAAVWIGAALYLYLFLDRGWIPHDEGTIAQSAQRVLGGELPHRDYDAGYTGGLTYLHAVGFRILGLRLLSLRWILFAFALAFVPALYAIARRFAAPWLAAMLTAMGVVWSVPNYFAGLPSWYNLFFATFGVLALLRHLESGRATGLVVAGLCAGASILFKIVGFYDVAAVLLFLAYREQVLAPTSANGGRAFFAVKAAGAAAFLSLLFAVFGRRDPMDALNFVVPGAALVGLILWTEWRDAKGGWSGRGRALGRLYLPFLLGVLAPLVLFTLPYVRAGAIPSLVHGVFVQPWKTVATARTPFPPLHTLWPAVPYGLLLVVPVGRGRQHSLALLLSVPLLLALIFAPAPEIYQGIWTWARSLGVLGVLAGCWLLLGQAQPALRSQQLFLLLCATALVGLVQFPYASPIYFCYVAPLAGLTVAALVMADARAPRVIHLVILVFFIGFAVRWMNRGYVFRLGRYFEPYVARTPLNLPRGGLMVPAEDARVYEDLIRGVQERGGSRDIYAGPDCPEVYFLSGYRNPTRNFFDYQGELYGHPEALLRLLEARGSRVVVLNGSPAFSQPPSAEFRAAVRARFPHAREIGKFTLLWRD